ncbi:uncharacterized protein LOC128257334 [Drosophila gunungcola]|uniref:Uncharacterized protein n=1 Tax=Drosophila gunungcola TaxID=103775 RepID=A0A9Q0BS39_9MUSC|nr:uncharacterized protein LOC128257334 [Drosophila gunungcola]KAI8041764.1 hypothetical protein M5D96_006033 [Drosophila gunungcola]
MKSETLHKFLAFCSLLIACAWSQPLNSTQQKTTHQQLLPVQRPVFFIKHNIRAEDAKNYQITIPKNPEAGEPCLTITWKTNPDGSGPAEPQIFMGSGYLGILPPVVRTPQRK